MDPNPAHPATLDQSIDRLIGAMFGHDPPSLDRTALLTTVEALPPGRRALLIEFFFDGLSVSEMASRRGGSRMGRGSTPGQGEAIVRPSRRQLPLGIVGQINAALRVLLSPRRLADYLRRSGELDPAAEDLAHAAEGALVAAGWATQRSGFAVLGSRGIERLAAEPAAGGAFGVEIAIAELLRRPNHLRRVLVAGSDQGLWSSSGLRADLAVGSPWFGREKLEIMMVWPDGQARRTALRPTAWWPGQLDD